MKIIAFDRLTRVFQEEIISSKTEKLQRYLIGNSPKCDLILNSSKISCIHAIIFYFQDNYSFIDLCSTNGSRINNQKVELNREYILNTGDTIQIGDFFIFFEEIKNKSKPCWFSAKNTNVYKSPYTNTVNNSFEINIQTLNR